VKETFQLPLLERYHVALIAEYPQTCSPVTENVTLQQAYETRDRLNAKYQYEGNMRYAVRYVEETKDEQSPPID
jgi:hypothetical protein